MTANRKRRTKAMRMTRRGPTAYAERASQRNLAETYISKQTSRTVAHTDYHLMNGNDSAERGCYSTRLGDKCYARSVGHGGDVQVRATP